jgi:hypothetical protein
MSQTRVQESATGSTTPRRINFSDGNHALHVQALLTWLPDDLHDAPGIDWTQLPSAVIGYLVNTAGENPWASSLALAAAIGRGAMKEQALKISISCLNCLLSNVQKICGIEQVSELTKSVWESYVTQKELTPGDARYFKIYTAFTESHFPDHLDHLNPRERAKFEPYLLPRLPRGFCKQHFPRLATDEGEKQRRKGKSDVLAPLHSLLVALVRFRKQSAQRLLSAYHEALSHAKTGEVEFPFPFSYEEELGAVNRDARAVAEVHLEKRPVTLHFLLWDRRSWVKQHPSDYQSAAIKRKADRGIGEFAKPQFFVQCLNPADELLWFGDLIKYRLLQRDMPGNITPEDARQRQQILAQLGIVRGLSCTRDGILTPAQDLTLVLCQAIARTGTLVFDVEALCRGALFASALTTIALTNGSRMSELLQVSADRFKVRPYAVQKDGNLARQERVMHLQWLLPKGKRTEAERKLFPISDWSWDQLREIAQDLKSAHQGRIPVVRPHPHNTKAEDLSPERYLFQWDASPDGKSGSFHPEDVASLLRFILYGLDFRTREGEPFSVSMHLLRHVMANAASNEHAVPMNAVARVLHHEQRGDCVPAATLYYGEATEDQSLAVFASFQTDLEVWAASLLVELPNAQEVAGMEDDLRESFERWHTLLETTLGFCGNPDLCPRGYNRTLCVGCPHLVVDPRKRKHALHWRNAYVQYASDLEAKGSTLDARQVRLHIQDLERHIKEMDLLQQAIEDGRRKPVFLLLPSAPYQEVIVDAQA